MLPRGVSGENVELRSISISWQLCRLCDGKYDKAPTGLIGPTNVEGYEVDEAGSSSGGGSVKISPAQDAQEKAQQTGGWQRRRMNGEATCKAEAVLQDLGAVLQLGMRLSFDIHWRLYGSIR